MCSFYLDISKMEFILSISCNMFSVCSQDFLLNFSSPSTCILSQRDLSSRSLNFFRRFSFSYHRSPRFFSSRSFCFCYFLTFTSTVFILSLSISCYASKLKSLASVTSFGSSNLVLLILISITSSSKRSFITVMQCKRIFTVTRIFLVLWITVLIIFFLNSTDICGFPTSLLCYVCTLFCKFLVLQNKARIRHYRHLNSNSSNHMTLTVNA